MTKFIKSLFLGITLALVVPSVSYGENQQDYVQRDNDSKRYIELSRAEVAKNNYPLAKAYAQKAIQANAWDKLAWANYDDVMQKIADEGDIADFGTVLEQSKSSDSPKAGGAQFEGC